ncbi:hypothetical protein LTR78_005998 [Recurvomyces mirabilis]|uniref:U3 small nucleolar RNA-associated protein 11 n=1 Tax=Recurvomyces mirabilis TaxID=574656 RepID=A0AAE0WLZ5_9PEZI|nr:hypothetical protein LTR78_005998 [Recurvomyces mirabilis]KAK5155191.1 hypothetical protein LTS14_006146 [Recurvomyces mirabilis]
MSSMRNAVQRRNHKERDQPQERKKWGLLEKHRDYSLRAADHNTKKRKLKALQAKASERNEDEFYFGMMSGETVGGVKRARRGEGSSGGAGRSLGLETVKLMKTQDEGYLRTAVQSSRRLRERLERGVVVQEEMGVGSVPGGKRDVFSDDDGEEGGAAVPLSDVVDGDDALDLDDLAELQGLDAPVMADEVSSSEEDAAGLSKAELNKRRRKRHDIKTRRRQVEALRDREEQLTIALREVEAQRARMNGTVGGVNKKGTRFKVRQRKR